MWAFFICKFGLSPTGSTAAFRSFGKAGKTTWFGIAAAPEFLND
jgi:hypothetical protein